MITSIIIIGLLALVADVLCLLSIYRMAGYMSNKWSDGYLTRKRCWLALTLVAIVLLLGPVADYTSHLSGFVRRWMLSTSEYSCPVSYLAVSIRQTPSCKCHEVFSENFGDSQRSL